MNAFFDNVAPRLSRWLLVAILFIPLVITPSTIFPFVFGKEILARTLTALAFALWLPLALKNPDYRPKRTALLWAVLVFLGVYFLAGIFGESWARSFWSTAERMGGFFGLLHWSAFLVMIGTVFKDRAAWEQVLRLNLGVSFLVSFYGLLQYLGLDLGFVYLTGQDRVAGTLGNPTFLALYLTFAVFSAGALLTREKRLWWKVVYGALIVFELAVIGLSETRGAVLGISLAGLLLLGLWLLRAQKNWQKALAAFGILSILGAGGLLIFGKDLPVVKHLARQVPLLTRLTSTSLAAGSAATRLASAQTGLRAWQERPILGWGPENYTLAFSKHLNSDFYKIKSAGGGVWFDKAHNQPIEVLVTTGLVGLISYLAIFAVFGLYLYRLFQKERGYQGFYLWLGAGFLAYFIQLLFLFDSPATTLEFFLFLGLINSFYTERFSGRLPVWCGGFSWRGTKLVSSFFVAVVLVSFILYQYEIKPWRANQLTKQAIEAETADPTLALTLFQQAVKTSPVLTLNTRRRAADMVSKLLAEPQLKAQQKKALVDLGVKLAKENIALAPDYKDKVILARIYVNSSGALADAPRLALEAALSAEKAGPNRREHLRVLSFAYFLNGDFQQAKKALLRFKVLGGALNQQDKEYLKRLEALIKQQSA